MDKNVFFRAVSKKAIQKHMITPAIWSAPSKPISDDDIIYPDLSKAKGWVNMDVKDIEKHCMDNNLICFYSKGELLFIKKEGK